MQVKVVNGFTPLQELVACVVRTLRQRRLHSQSVVMERVLEVILTVPAAMERMDRLGWRESTLTQEQADTLLQAVKLNLAFYEGEMFYDGTAIYFKRQQPQQEERRNTGPLIIRRNDA